MTSLAELIASTIVSYALIYLVVRLDERWMSEENLERAWPPTSRDAAIIAFGPLALLLHFIRTRGGFSSFRRFGLGFPLGTLMAAAALVGVSLVGSIIVNLILMLLGYPVDWSLE